MDEGGPWVRGLPGDRAREESEDGMGGCLDRRLRKKSWSLSPRRWRRRFIFSFSKIQKQPQKLERY